MNRAMELLSRIRCGILLGFVEGVHCRCVLPLGHDGPHTDRTNRWWS